MDLCTCFSNPRRQLKSLISCVLRGSRRPRRHPDDATRVDQRGPVTKNSVQTQTRLSASNRAEVLAGYVAGVPVRVLADRFGVHRATVWKIARSAGLDVRRPELAAEVRERAARLYAGGMTLAEVANELRISDDSVRSAVVACGGTIRPRGRQRALV